MVVGEIKVKWLKVTHLQLLVTLFPRHQNKKETTFLRLQNLNPMFWKNMCTCSISISFPPHNAQKRSFLSYCGLGTPADYLGLNPSTLTRFPSRTTHTFEDLLEGHPEELVENPDKEPEPELETDPQGKHRLFFQTLKRGDGCTNRDSLPIVYT